MKNIFLIIRESANLSQKEMGRLADITEQTVSNYEQGLISNPPEHVVKAYLDVWDPPVARGGLVEVGHDYIKYSPSGILDAYQMFIYRKRVRNSQYIAGPNASMLNFKPGRVGHPFMQWREQVLGSRKRFCNLYCVPYSSLERYETSGYILPDWLTNVLLTAGVGGDELDKMDLLIKEWYRARH